jgi:hypothetical protein
MKTVITFTGEEYCTFSSNCVYAWKRKEEWLYIGFSTHGLTRPFAHNTINHIEKVQPQDQLICWAFENKFDAQLKEMELILTHKPKYNKEQDANTLFCTLLGKTKTVKGTGYKNYCTKPLKHKDN